MERKNSFSDLSPECREHLARLAYNQLNDRSTKQFTFTCQQRTWTINEALVCAAIPYIAALLKEHDFPMNEIVLRNALPSAVNAVVSYIQTGDYDDDEYEDEEFTNAVLGCGAASDISDASSLLLNCHVFNLAIDYGITALQNLAVRKIKQQAEHEVCRQYFPAAADFVYQCVLEMDEVKKVIIDACKPHAEKILAPDSWLTHSERTTYGKLREVASNVVNFKAALQEAAPHAGSTACGHDCATSTCAGEWHICKCRGCWKKVELKGLVLKAETVIYCPSCASAGCTVAESEMKEATSAQPEREIRAPKPIEEAEAASDDLLTPGMKALRSARFRSLWDTMIEYYPLPPNYPTDRVGPYWNVKDHWVYNKDFLLLFQYVCKEKPSLDWDERVREIQTRARADEGAETANTVAERTIDGPSWNPVPIRGGRGAFNVGSRGGRERGSPLFRGQGRGGAGPRRTSPPIFDAELQQTESLVSSWDRRRKDMGWTPEAAEADIVAWPSSNW